MKIAEVVEGIALRCNNMDADRCAALASDMRAAGMRDGPNLQTAFDKWRASWTKRVPPTAAEFAAFSVEASKAKTGPAFNTEERVLWDKAWKDVRGYEPLWQPGQRERADELGYLKHWRENRA